MPDSTLDLPLILNGRSRMPSDVDPSDRHELRYESGLTIRLPRLLHEDVDELQRQAPQIDAELAELTVPQIITYLAEVGERWDARRSPARLMVRRYGHLVTQFPDMMMESDYTTIGHLLMQRWHLYDEIESQFGDQRIFDEWIPLQMSYRRAFPRGQVLHYLVGNLPLASLYSLIRAMVTKNRSLAKLPTRDPISPIGLAQAVIEVDPGHPVSRALSLAYWPHDDEVGDRCVAATDAACVWGGAQAVTAVKRKVPAGVPLIEFGPKWSATALDLTRCDPQDAAMRVVEDSSFYDQEACFNTQRVYVRGDLEPFLAALGPAFETFRGHLPFVSTNRDAHAHRSMTLLEAQYLGHPVHSGPDWAVVVLPADHEPLPHPRSRTLFVHPVDDLATVARYLDRDSQTMSVLPWELAQEHGTRWAAAGTDRLVEAGFSRMPRAGFTHDAMLGMHAFVRLACIERPWSDPGRYYTRRPDYARHYLVDKYPHVRRLLDADSVEPVTLDGSLAPSASAAEGSR